ncbi:hypothetical protein [Thiohalocapsa sp. ML1]|jgi:hypothetical protein|uniref:hypothetical protein n=1 Tax=Thiohalocapsa sp. ML1 TaxID=1431688 RepID=UPI000731F6E1|nr:hypothetical protein [Thiohalocapsa sp. ML1]
MTKPVAFATLFLAFSVAATASLLNEPTPRTNATAVTTASAEDLTRRGTREPLVSNELALPVSFAQQRRGERPELAVAESAAAASAGDAIRRGSR